MKTTMKFDESLYHLLSDLDISMNRLSKAINVDCSLVNRWIHGKRIPAYNTTYIESISEYLSKKIQNSFQMQRLNELLGMVFEDIEMEDSVEKKIKKLLLESQGYSIECKKKERKERKTSSISKDQVYKFLNDCPHNAPDSNNLIAVNHSKDICNILFTNSLSEEYKIVLGSRNVLYVGLSLIEAAASKKRSNADTIYISFNNDIDITSLHNDLIHCRNVLLKALLNGWKIIFLLRLNNNVDRTIKFINFMRPLIETGKFIPYYLRRYDIFTTGKEVLVVPGIGALSCYTTKAHSEVDSGFYLTAPTAVDILQNYFNVLLATSAEPLIKYYFQDNNMEYGHCLTKNEESIGKRFMYKYGFSILTLPENLYKKLLKREKLSHDEMLKALEFHKRRLDAFLSNLQNFEHKDIYMFDSIENLVMHRQFYFYSYSGINIMTLEVQDIIEHLQNIINLLEKYDNYKIAFMQQIPGNNERHVNFYWMVKERQAVLLETFEPLKNMPEVRLSIEEPTLVKAFEEYFKDIWEQIAPVNKEKKEVVKWLQSQIDLLKNKNCMY